MTDFPPPSEPSQESVATTEPGWYFDGTQQRWWDGTSWGPIQTSSDDSTFATLSHLGSVLGGFVLSLVMYLISKDGRRPETRRHAREALNFQLTFMIVYIPAVIAYVVFVFSTADGTGDEASAGFFLGFGSFMLFVLVTSVLAIVFGVRGAIRANRGEHYRYPICIRFIKGSGAGHAPIRR